MSAQRYNFNPPAPCGAGPIRSALPGSHSYFNPPAPCGAGLIQLGRVYRILHFNPPAPCGAGPPVRQPDPAHPPISIHPPLAGRDLLRARVLCAPFPISIHPPLAGRDGATQFTEAVQSISIHPPLAGRDYRDAVCPVCQGISIHPPLAGRDSDLAQKNCAKHRILHKKCIYPGRIERFSGFDAAIFLPNVHKFRCEPSEESLLAPRSHAYTIRTPSG